MRSSKPTVWDGDECEGQPHSTGGTVLSPPCGMVTLINKFVRVLFIACSKPTVWDGDVGVGGIETPHLCIVLSPPCGMATQTERGKPNGLGTEL